MASQGPNNPGTAATSNEVGTLTWSTPNNILSEDSNTAYSMMMSAPATVFTHYLKASNFGFVIPSGATINGIMCEIKRRRSFDNYTNDSEVKIIKSNASIGTTNKADTTTQYPQSLAYKSYGGSADLWGETWSSTDINDADFGLAMSVKLTGNTKFDLPGAFIDHIRITVYYTEGTTAAVKSIGGILVANIKSVIGTVIGNVKSYFGIAK